MSEITLETFIGQRMAEGFSIEWLADGLWLMDHPDGRSILLSHDAASGTFSVLEGEQVADSETTAHPEL